MRNHYYIITTKDGYFCYWTLETNRGDAWRKLTKDTPTYSIKQLKRDGYRSVKVRLDVM